MNPLEIRKQLLISESEVNRVMLVREFEVLAGGVRHVSHRAKRWGLVASSLLLLACGLSGSGKHGQNGEKRTKTQMLFAELRGAAAGLLNLWAIRS